MMLGNGGTDFQASQCIPMDLDAVAAADAAVATDARCGYTLNLWETDWPVQLIEKKTSNDCTIPVN